jgi:ATP-dependent DNA ligase
VLLEPLERRRQVLAEAMKGKAAPIVLSETLDASPTELVRVAKKFGFEGIVAKRKDSLYEPANEQAHGSNTRSTGGKSLLLAVTRRGIRLMR